ncbi:MAG TPA: hypothetical protein VHL52_13445, partial [Acidimicrobiia bacterium]|nr:hypothetical protein [Acidimicrobiia bacterium]
STDVRDPLEAFVDRLVAQHLMVETDGSVEAQDVRVAEVTPFEPPVLEEFDEMKEMLLYDPIHDVDETGWPNLPEPSIRHNE